MSGLVAQLEDARELAEKLRDELAMCAATEEDRFETRTASRITDLADAADDLVSRIDNLRTALRGT